MSWLGNLCMLGDGSDCEVAVEVDCLFYGTVSAASGYFDSRLRSTDWFDATPARQQASLVEATALIDQFDYINQKYTVSILADDATDEEIRLANLEQTCQFPRGSVDTVPAEIERACYLIGKALLSGREPDMDNESLSATSTAYGSVRTSYSRDGNTQEHMAHLIPSPQAFNLLKPFFRERNQFRIDRT